MTDHDLSVLLSDLEDSAKKLNAESDSVVAILESVESRLVGMNIGLETWLEERAIESHTDTDYDDSRDDDVGRQIARRTEVGFAKVAGEWCLAIRGERGDFDAHLGGFEWSHEKLPTRLRDASRQLRIAALPAIPNLLKAVSEKAKLALANIAEAKKLVK